MSANTDGLNFVPLLTQNTPPSSGRTGLSSRKSIQILTSSRSVQSARHFNGNYEGDFSMFSPIVPEKSSRQPLLRLEHLDLIESGGESDNELSALLNEDETELESSITKINSTISASSVYGTSFIVKPRSLCSKLTERFLNTKFGLSMQKNYEKLQKNVAYQKLQQLLQIIFCYTLWIFNIFYDCIAKIFKYSINPIGRNSPFLLHNATKRILWTMTFCKCSDFAWYALIILCTPILLVVAAIGFTISAYGHFKQACKFLCEKIIKEKNF